MSLIFLFKKLTNGKQLLIHYSLKSLIYFQMTIRSILGTESQ